MDPNENLKSQLELAAKIVKDWENHGPSVHDYSIDEEEAAKLAELVLALDEWISRKGGFLPESWLAAGWVRS